MRGRVHGGCTCRTFAPAPRAQPAAVQCVVHLERGDSALPSDDLQQVNLQHQNLCLSWESQARTATACPAAARAQARHACVRDAIRLAGTKPCCARAPWPATLRASTTDWCGVIKNNRTLPESAGAGTACMRAYTGGAPGARLSLRRERAQPAAVQLVVRLGQVARAREIVSCGTETDTATKIRRLPTPPVPFPYS